MWFDLVSKSTKKYKTIQFSLFWVHFSHIVNWYLTYCLAIETKFCFKLSCDLGWPGLRCSCESFEPTYYMLNWSTFAMRGNRTVCAPYCACNTNSMWIIQKQKNADSDRKQTLNPDRRFTRPFALNNREMLDLPLVNKQLWCCWSVWLPVGHFCGLMSQ